MATLPEIITQQPKRGAVVNDLAKLVDEEVGDKGGLAGAGIKLAYGAVKAIKPGFIPEVVNGMLDEWATRLQPLYAEALAAGGPVGSYLKSRAPAVADALLSVTDDRAKKTTHATAKKAYDKLRPTGKKHVEEAVPRLAALLEKHTKA